MFVSVSDYEPSAVTRFVRPTDSTQPPPNGSRFAWWSVVLSDGIAANALLTVGASPCSGRLRS